MSKSMAALAAVVMSAALLVPTVSHAEDTQSVRVSYADLNLATAIGQDRLDRRVAFAAKVACDLGETSSELRLASLTQTCRDGAIAGVQPQLAAAITSARRGTVTVLDGAALIVTAQ